jgi:hypothetical protein
MPYRPQLQADMRAQAHERVARRQVFTPAKIYSGGVPLRHGRLGLDCVGGVTRVTLANDEGETVTVDLSANELSEARAGLRFCQDAADAAVADLWRMP